MAKNKNDEDSVGLGLGLIALFLLLRGFAGDSGVSFSVGLQGLPSGATTWDASWWDGKQLVPNSLGPNRPVSQAALFKNVTVAVGSFFLATVMINGSPVQQSATMPFGNPVNGGVYVYDWPSMLLFRLA